MDCSGQAKTFSVEVKPNIQAACSSCHEAGSNNGPGELTSYSQIFNARADIRSAVISGLMPLGGSLSVAQRIQLLDGFVTVP